jgi:hypothetical protein
MVDNGDTFQKITTTNATFVNTAVAVTAGETYRYTATLKGTGSVLLVWQQRGGAYKKYVQQPVVLTGTAQTVSFDTVIPSDGAPTQIGVSDINTTETVFIKDVKIDQVLTASGIRGNLALNDPIKPVYSSTISTQISPQSIIVQPLGVGSSTDPFPGFGQATSLVAGVQDFPQWGTGKKVISATVPYGAAENNTTPWHLRGASTGITNPSLQIEPNKDYLFDFSMQIPSESATQKLTLYPQQFYGTPPNRQIAGLCLCGGSGFSFYTAIQADGVYLYVLPPLGTIDANGYSTDNSTRLKLSNGNTIPFDQKLHFQIFYTPSNSGKIVATLVGQQTQTFTGATVTTDYHEVRLYNRARPDMLAAGQSSTVYLGDLGVFGITPGAASSTIFQTNYQALTDGRLIEDLGPDARIKGDPRIDQGFFISQFDMQAKALGTRRGGASQPRITTAFGLKAVSFNSANGDKWTNSSGSDFRDYPRSEVDGGDYEYRTLKFARNYELTGWLAFPTDPTAVAADAPNGNTYQIGFQFHSKAHRGSSPVQMVMNKNSGWTFMMAPNFFQDANCTVKYNGVVQNDRDGLQGTNPRGVQVNTLNPQTGFPGRRFQQIMTAAEVQAAVGKKLLYRLEWRPARTVSEAGYLRMYIDLNSNGVIDNATELVVNLVGPNSYPYYSMSLSDFKAEYGIDAPASEIQTTCGADPFIVRPLDSTKLSHYAGTLKMGIYDYNSLILPTNPITLYAGDISLVEK